MIGVVSVLNDPVCPGHALPSVDVPEAGKCCPADASGTSHHSVKDFPILRAAIAVLTGDGCIEYRPYFGCAQRCGGLEFPQLSKLIKVLP